GWCYNLVPMFALAGRIESHYREASKKKGIRDRDDQLSKADLVYKQYCKSDPEDRFQIPAAEAHLAMARVSNLRGERNEAVRRAERALKVARGQTVPFHYGSAAKRAEQFLIEELKQTAAPLEEPGLDAMDHDDRLWAWMKKRDKAGGQLAVT